MNLSRKDHPKVKFRLHIIEGALIALTLILIIARIADKGTPRSRTNSWGIAVVSSSMLNLASV